MKKRKEPQPFNQLEAEIAISGLHTTGEYLVLRKINLDRDHRFSHKIVPDVRVGLCLDTETTGLDQRTDRIIELGIVAFEFDPRTAQIIRITDRYNGFEDPGEPLKREIVEITGITDQMLTGQQFDHSVVAELAQQASLMIAHNAGFDRPFVEQRFPEFKQLTWACTVNQIDWQAERLPARSLEYLLFKFGWYINAHRALDDAEGVLGLLLEQLPVSGGPIFKALLEASARSISRIYALNAPFDKKEQLKQRGYRWSDGSGSTPKCWWISVPESNEQPELAFLADQIYPGGKTGGVEIKRISPLDRFSIREG